jgi:tetratricopeptide (TPR) repeat protein
MAFHNLAMVKRDLCKLDEAEQFFRRALELREKNPDTLPTNLSGTLFEFAQLQYEQGHYADAASLIERGLPIVEKADVERRAPAAFARLLAEYADALRRVDRTADAEAIDARVKTLSAAYGIDMQQKLNFSLFNHPPCR